MATMINTMIKFVYSEKATKFCEIFTLLLSTVHTDKSKVKISQKYVAFSEYMNFKHMNFEDDKKSEKSMGGKLTLPNIKDCTNSKYDYLHVLFFVRARVRRYGGEGMRKCECGCKRVFVQPVRT